MTHENVRRAIFDRTDGRCHLCEKNLALSNYGRLGARGAWEVDPLGCARTWRHQSAQQPPARLPLVQPLKAGHDHARGARAPRAYPQADVGGADATGAVASGGDGGGRRSARVPGNPLVGVVGVALGTLIGSARDPEA